jgi:hypothetical protein
MINKNLYKIIWSIGKIYFSTIKNKHELVPKLFGLIDESLKRNGTLYTIKYFKQCRLHYTRYICGQPLWESTHGVVLNSRGLPINLEFLEPLLNQGVMGRKYLLTLLTITRAIDPKKNEDIKYDLSSITKTFSGKIKTLDKKIIFRIIKSMRINKQSLPLFSYDNFPAIYTSGPHGPSMLTAWRSLLWFNKELLLSVSNLLCFKGKIWLDKQVEFAKRYLWDPSQSKEMKTKNHCLTAQLSIVKDPECKMRIIAMFDWYSQNVLDIISNKIFKILRDIPTDRTYTQDPFFNHIQIKTRHKFHSLDLTAATDRFPLAFQQQIIEILFNEDVAKAWGEVLTDRWFLGPENEVIKYEVGQPMGARSSWAVFTLSHHILVRYAAWLLGKKNFKHYILLGDDIVINDDQVAKMYKKLIRLLGVEISDTKSHVSADTYEFAKRWIVNNKIEISPLPLRGISENFDNIYLTYQNLYSYFIEKGNIWTAKKNFVTTVADLISQVNKRKHCEKVLPNKKVKISRMYLSSKRLIKRLTPLNVLLRFKKDLITQNELRQFLLEYSNLDLIPNSLNEMKEIFKDYLEYSLLHVSDNIYRKMDNYYQDIFYGKSNLRLDKYTLPNHPIFTGILNQITKFDKILQSIFSKEYVMSDVVRELTFIDPKLVLLSDKRVIKERVLLGNISRRILITLKSTSFNPFALGIKSKDLEWKTRHLKLLLHHASDLRNPES